MSRVLHVLAGVLAVPAAGLTLARLVGGSRQQLATVQAFAPWAVPAYLLVLLALGALLVRPATRGRVPAVGALVAVAALVLHLAWLAPTVVGAAPDVDPDAEPLTVMTANLELGGADAAQVVAAARERGVGLLVVQEVTPRALAALESAGLDQLLPHRAGEAGSGALGTLAFSRTPVASVARIGTTMGSWAFTTGGLRVLAVHPAYPLSQRWGAELATVRRAAQQERPDLVLGDLNASRDHAPLRAILATGLRDAAELVNAGWQPTWPVGGFRGWPVPTSVAIDHVLVGEELTATRTATLRIDDTDHRALVATVVRRAS